MADAFREFGYRSSDGLLLAARIYGPSSSSTLPVVCLPGLTRNARDFHELALHLSQPAGGGRQVICFDYRGRGRSDRDPNWHNYDVVVEAGDVIAGITALGVEHAAIIGTSRGGLITFALTAMRPTLMKAVVLNDIGPVIDGAGLALIRAYLTRAPKPSNLAEAVAFQKQVNGSAFSALSDADVERSVRAFYREEKGRLVPDFDPALIRTVTSLNLDRPLPVLWPQFMGLSQIPVLAIRGANSSLLSSETLELMKSRHPNLSTIVVEGQGHAPLLETDGLPQKIAAFLERADRRVH